VNHHHTAVSLAFRLAIAKDKVKENPARKIRRVPEDNNRVRYLSAEEEKKLREAIRSKPEWAEHEPELDLAQHTGLRRADMYKRLDLRHTFASRLRQSGTPLGNIAELLGHKTLAMSRRYAHLSVANLHEAVSRISTDTPIAPELFANSQAVSHV
jgi:site-specific recombinase XerD